MSEKLTDLFAIDVFNEATMLERLPKKTYAALKKTIQNGEDLDPSVAEVVANAMKDWAIERGATHYSHWFQPMTGITAEKHDSFINPTSDGKIIMEFSGKELIKGEPDASSFPSGGLRATFEARGYTAWDCTSPAFLREDAAGVTLCIPTAFCSYTGEALDMKTPLLRSMEALSTQATRICKLFGHDVKKVSPSVGPEQEYFLIDKAKYLQRDDLIFSGRTLFGAMPPKGQELDDHYFGCIKERVACFMKELNVELWKLGVTAKTQHNEAAPAQHELAPIYATANIATDHNQLVMECMKRIANRHNLACLLHEKPFAGVNGSGKHDNWSMVTDTGKNLLDPGKTPHENIQFLLFLSAVLKAVDLHADLLRVSAANPGNDHRLGGYEAPPAIISVYLGTQLEDVILQLIETGEAKSSKDGGKLNVGVHTLPELKKDATDRNRTSPFAFTGNKFEFRMVASSMSIGPANTTLNTIVADVLSEMADELEAATDFDLAVHDLIKKTLTEHQRIVFNGNGYSQEWVEEAERRGLPNIRSMVEAIPALVTEKAIKMFEKHHVFSAVELHSRAEIMYETYAKAINIEARTMISMASVQYIPAVIKYTKRLADSINAIKEAVPDADISVQTSLLKEISSLLAAAQTALKKLQKLVSEASSINEIDKMAIFYRNNVFPAMAELREPIDALEVLVDKDLWPVPTYGEMLFEV
ncbi:glutamine synthetase III [Lachnospiraceae bacterium MD1]|uniref:Glutamine synthetase III n=1 Tax=Variimorphobacter saccharofermentans TaxID=2755051 RepID=A0A839JXX2_9FIRM|nr:glutamine synthetase III [Variimorphobacter saccharofermentans]MBB2182256.1 glutamine synthetase III [Variimorphobacter saccharofermentans]